MIPPVFWTFVWTCTSVNLSIVHQLPTYLPTVSPSWWMDRKGPVIITTAYPLESGRRVQIAKYKKGLSLLLCTCLYCYNCNRLFCKKKLIKMITCNHSYASDSPRQHLTKCPERVNNPEFQMFDEDKFLIWSVGVGVGLEVRSNKKWKGEERRRLAAQLPT